MYNLNMVIYISEWSVDQQIGIYEKSCKVIYNKILSYDGKIDVIKKKIYNLTLLSTFLDYYLIIIIVNYIFYINIIIIFMYIYLIIVSNYNIILKITYY